MNDIEHPRRDRYAAAVVAVIVVVGIVLRINLLDVPLERDEGEYAYLGQRLLLGEAPWVHAWNMKLPGASLVYAAIMGVFGQTAVAIHLGLLLVNATTTVLVFLLGRRLFDTTAGVVAAGVWTFLSISRQVLGSQAHATHFLVLAVVGAFFVLLTAIEQRRGGKVVGAGVLLGIAVLMKQHAVFFIPAAVLVIAMATSPLSTRLRFSVVLVVGAVVPVVLVGIWLAAAGVLSTAWFWTVTYAITYASDVSFAEAMAALATLPSFFAVASVPVWLVALAAIVLVVVTPSTRRAAVPALLLLIGGAAATAPGFFFRAHYFVMVLPGVALVVGASITALRALGGSRGAVVGVVVVVGAVGIGVVEQRDYLFESDPLSISRSMYGESPFIEATVLGAWLNERTAVDDTIGIIGSEPELAFLAQRRLASGYLYMYPLLERHGFAAQMQQQWRDELQAALPRYMVLVDIDLSWGQPSSVVFAFLHELEPWLQAHYRPVMLVPIALQGETEARAIMAPADAPSQLRRVNRGIVVFERR